jgi:hypothetical protein
VHPSGAMLFVHAADNDGVIDVLDNCVFAANTNQRDIDEDLIGDVCTLLFESLSLTRQLPHVPQCVSKYGTGSGPEGVGCCSGICLFPFISFTGAQGVPKHKIGLGRG